MAEVTLRKRQQQWLLIGSTLVFSWLAMQAVHELGHVVGALGSGGKIGRAVLHPAAISSTQVVDNRHPLIVAWMGPITGTAPPLAALLPLRRRNIRGWYVAQFFAGFCLVANGAYLAGGSFERIGDASDLLRHGTPIGLLWLFGMVTIPWGIRLWHRLGSHFGLGPHRAAVDGGVACGMLALVLAIVAIELVLN